MAGQDPIVVSEADAARLLNVGPRTLQGWRLNGTGPDFVTLGQKRIGYLKSTLLEWVQSRVVKSTSEASTRGRAA